MNKMTDRQTVGFTFIISGVGMMVALGTTLGWVFAPGGIALVIVGLTYLSNKGDEE